MLRRLARWNCNNFNCQQLRFKIKLNIITCYLLKIGLSLQEPPNISTVLLKRTDNDDDDDDDVYKVHHNVMLTYLNVL